MSGASLIVVKGDTLIIEILVTDKSSNSISIHGKTILFTVKYRLDDETPALSYTKVLSDSDSFIGKHIIRVESPDTMNLIPTESNVYYFFDVKLTDGITVQTIIPVSNCSVLHSVG